ncbi:MAG: PD-(D/E)XK nuclease family protein [Ignisphaera sp.]
MENELNIVNLLYSWRIAEAKKRLEGKLSNEIYATDLIYCPLKYRYQRTYSELALGTAFNPVTLYGEIIHQGLEKLLSILFGEDNVRVEVEYEKNIQLDLDKNTYAYVIKGRIDAIVGDYIIEIKSGSSDRNLPYEQHIIQARIYMWLSNLDKAILLYVTPNRIVEYQITGTMSDKEITELVKSIITGQPAPRYIWECKYCIYSILCPFKRTST